MPTTCDWSDPGLNPFTGNRSAAVMQYADIPPDTRQVLAARVAARQYDDVAAISAAGISSPAGTYTGLRSMYFGANRRCDVVTRTAWPFDRVERALRYTEAGYTVLVPTVCGNVSRADLVPGGVLPALVDPTAGLRTGVSSPTQARRNTVPEPSSLGLIALALTAAAWARRTAA